MDKKSLAYGVVGLVLAALAPVIIFGSTQPNLGDFLIPDFKVWLSEAMVVVPALVPMLFALALIKEFVGDRNARIVLWSLAAVVGFLIIMVLNVPLIPGVFLLGTYLGGFLPLITDDPCKRGIWKTVTAPKGLGALLVFAVAYFMAVESSQSLQTVFINKIVQMSISSVGSGPAIDINAILSPTVTPAERERLIENIQESTPDWNQLTPAQQEELIQNYLKVYQQTKAVIYKTLAQSIRVPDRAALEAGLRREIENTPILQKILNYLPAITGFSVAIYYSFVEFIAEIISFILAVPLLLLVRRSTHD